MINNSSEKFGLWDNKSYQFLLSFAMLLLTLLYFSSNRTLLAADGKTFNLANFWLVEIAMMLSIAIVFVSYQQVFSWMLTEPVFKLFGALFGWVLLVTLVMPAIPAQGVLKKAGQLILIFGVSIGAAFAGHHLREKLWAIKVALFIPLLIISLNVIEFGSNAGSVVFRPYGWSAFVIPLMLWLILRVYSTSALIGIAAVFFFVFLAIDSATRTIIGWVAVISLEWVMKLKGAQAVRVWIAVSVAFIGGGFAFLDSHLLDDLIERFVNPFDTERDLVWHLAILQFEQLPLLTGGGYFDYPLLDQGENIIVSAHNALLQIALNGGAVGVSIFLALSVIVLKRAVTMSASIAFGLIWVGAGGEIPLGPVSYSRMYECILLWFVLGFMGIFLKETRE